MPHNDHSFSRLGNRIARNLTAAFLAGHWSAGGLERSGAIALGQARGADWLSPLILEILDAVDTPYPPAPRRLFRLIRDSDTLDEAMYRMRTAPALEDAITAAPRFAPAPPLRDLDIPRLQTQHDLADWLGLPFSKIEWFADIEGYRAAAREESVRHYRYVWVPRRSGPPRLIEAPKPFLKVIQRQILRDILDKVPAHDAAHGFRKGRSCVTGATRHAGEAVVLAADLRDFFPSVPARRVHGLFRSLGYPWGVARYLTGLCTNAAPADVFLSLPVGGQPGWPTRDRLSGRHLPQGAPTSPALANLCAWRLDRRLDGLAASVGARYTRYADDLAFSGDDDFAARVGGFRSAVAEICADEGFALNPRKTRVMGQGGRQRLTGLVINQHVNVPRDAYDRLKAILHNCARRGPESQNRDAHPDFRRHLDGRVTWVENVNPRKGLRLRQAFEAIDWDR